MDRIEKFALIVVVIALALAVSVGAAAARSIGPGEPPPQCAPGDVPPGGLLGTGGCLIQSGEVSFSLSPHVLRVGEDITGTVTPNPQDEHPAPQWSWGNIEAVLGEGAHNPGKCADDATTCTFEVGPDIASTKWQVYSMAVQVPIVGGVLAGAVSSDYFIVDDHLHQLSGLVSNGENDLGQPIPAAGIAVEVTGDDGSDRITTGADGKYSFALVRGVYRVAVVGSAAAHATPGHYRFDLTHDIGGADFELNARDKIEFHFTALPGVTTAGNATIDGVGPAVTSDTTVTDPDGNPAAAILQFTPTAETPRALVCTPTGLVYPQLDSAGNPTSFNPFDVASHELGHVPMDIYAGSESGAWNLDAIEAARQNPASASTALDFAIAPRTVGVPDVAQRFYSLLASIRGAGGNRGSIPIFRLTVPSGAVSPGQVTAARSDDQEILLAFLEANFASIGTDFGPVHTGGSTLSAGRAAVEFYYGTQTAVLDTDAAEAIEDAAGSGAPLPSQYQFLPTAAEYEDANGPLTPGHLTPDPSDPLTYFGFPYPPLSSDGIVDSRFYSHCVRPDFLQLRVEVDSPVDVLFTNAAGEKFGFAAGGTRIDTATGLELPHGRERTYILPAGDYTAALAGSGAGTAHVIVFSSGSGSERTQVFTFGVKRGQKGSFGLDASGARGSLTFAGHHYRAARGISLLVGGAPRRLRARHRTRLRLRVRDAVGRAVPGALIVVSDGRRLLAAVLTSADGDGRAQLPSLPRGRLEIRVTAPSALPARITVAVR